MREKLPVAWGEAEYHRCGERTLSPGWEKGTDASKGEGARQSDAVHCDLNRIMKEFVKTGVLPVGSIEGVFADVTELGDFRVAQDSMIKAREAFEALPPKVRLRFGNDALSFVEFAVDPKNLDEMIALGLLERAPAVVVEKTAAEKLAELELARREQLTKEALAKVAAVGPPGS